MKLIKWFLVFLMDMTRYISFNNTHGKFRGVYYSFDEATKGIKTLKGYNEDEIIDSSVDSFDRNDTKIMDYEYPIFFWLHQIFSETQTKGTIKVFDFGGRLGGHFFKFSSFINSYNFSWLVCEVEKMASMGKKKFENEQLKFTSFFEEANNSGHIFIVWAIQYVEGLSLPNALKLLTNKPRHVLLTRLPMQNQVKQFVTLQNQRIAFIPQYVFNKNDFIKDMSDAGYKLKIEWDNFTDSCIIPFHRDKSARIYTGLYFELKGNI